MKKFFGLVVLAFLNACATDNSVETVDKILAKKTFQFSIESCGCFGCAKEKTQVSIRENKIDATYYYMSYSESDRPNEKSRKLTWDSEKTDMLRKLFEEGLKQNNKTGFCTTQSTYKLSSSWLTVTFDDEACKFSEELAFLIE